MPYAKPLTTHRLGICVARPAIILSAECMPEGDASRVPTMESVRMFSALMLPRAKSTCGRSDVSRRASGYSSSVAAMGYIWFLRQYSISLLASCMPSLATMRSATSLRSFASLIRVLRGALYIASAEPKWSIRWTMPRLPRPRTKSRAKSSITIAV